MKSILTAALILAGAVTSCSSSSTAGAKATKLTIVAYDSFAIEPAAFATFTNQTGIEIQIVKAGDAGAMVSKAGLTAGNPEGDVLWGVDNTLLARAMNARIFSPYRSADLGALTAASTALIVDDLVTPVDEGDVCLNYDKAWFSARNLAVPTTFDDLLKPEYKDLLVVQNPATSSPGLAFLLGTIVHTSPTGWKDYWAGLKTNGVKIVDGWDQAYYEEFSGSSGKGPRPLVVSYASSPPAEMIFADPRPEGSPTAVIEATCFHQVEFAGVLRGTKYPAAAGELIDFMISKAFQETLPLTLFVYPARTDAELPPEFVETASRPLAPLNMDPATIEAEAQQWIAAWTDLMVR